MSSLRSVTRRRARPLRLTLMFALVVLAAISLKGAIDPLRSGALTMLPALVLAVMMLTRPYLGQRVLTRLCRRRPGRRRPLARWVIRVRPAAGMARGGRLIAAALAGRAPPLALAGC